MPAPLFDQPALERQVLLAKMQQPSAEADAGTQTTHPAGIGIAPYAALLGGQGADVATTIAALRNPNLAEGNPLGLGGTLAAKAGYTALAALMMRALAQHGHPTAAKAVGYIGGAAGAVPAVLNARTMAGAK